MMGTLSAGRRIILGGAVAGLGLAAAGGTMAQQPTTAPGLTEAMMQPLPDQRPAPISTIDLGDTSLAYWDTGGPAGAPAVILLHPGTGSHAIWGYQQPVLAQAGYRVIGYSRRGYLGSAAGAGPAGTAAGDLLKLVDALRIERFHAVGSAAGAIVGVDFTLSYPDRLHSAVFACTHMGITDPDYLAMSNGLRPKGFAEMPAEFREVGPSYRAVNPEGVAKWVELEHRALEGGKRVNQGSINRITWAALRGITVPSLLIGGDADLWAPPSVVRMFATNMPGSEMVILPEAGHSAYWEQPEAFNRTVLGFLAKHR
jgi:pimeloyl-ACP methyl ester carboxylesterase